MQSTQRLMNENERAFLDKLLGAHWNDSRRRKEGIEDFFVMWSALALAAVVTWMALAWLIRLASGFKLGFGSPFAIWVISVIVPVTAIYAVISSRRWLGGWKDQRPLLRKDLRDGLVTEEHLRLTAALCFEEDEHGLLIYCLHISDDRVFVVYDRSSMGDDYRSGPDKDDPVLLGRDLRIVSALHSGYVINRSFTGEPLPFEETLLLGGALFDGLEEDRFCDTPWDNLKVVFSHPAD